MLFLDATWQLLEQHPTAFEFSETYLAVLSDSTRVALFGTFLFNCPHQRVRQSTVSAALASGAGQPRPRTPRPEDAACSAAVAAVSSQRVNFPNRVA